MAFNPTKEQALAISAKGNILVSAAAGSGKTAVLVERVISKLSSKDGVSADKLLIVTFTNAAAAEMRGRIEKRLDTEITNDPSNVALYLQKHLLASAKICTIDSFCIDLVRENFEKAGISPDFKISDGDSLAPLNNEVLSKIFNSYLEEGNNDFLTLLDIIGTEYDEQGFLDFVLEIYQYSRQLPFPKKWFNSLSELYNDGVFNSDNPWWKYCFSIAKNTIKGAINAVDRAEELLYVSEKASVSYRPAFSEMKETLKKLFEISALGDWDELYNALSNLYLPSLPTVKGVNGILEIASAKEIFKSVSSKILNRLEKLFYADSSFINSQFEMLCGPIKILSRILCEFEDKLFECYKENNTFTFHNTEHLALEILCEEKNGEIFIKDDAADILNRFDEVMVDEYQDTNDLQDLLFYILSNKEKNLFVVGDVKQSIYGFRGANPKNFLAKKNRYKSIENSKENDAKKIILANNFRTRSETCSFINYFFELFMTKETGDILYDDEESLDASAVFPSLETAHPEIHIINSSGSDFSKELLEARYIAQYIKSTVDSCEIIKENETTLRKARYSDFTILLRSANTKAPLLSNELKRQGIPVNYSAEEFSETTEISTILSLLKVIDNPRSDIELLCVLLSPIFDFSPDEVAKIRILNRKTDLFSAVIEASNSENLKALNFLKKIEHFRLLSVTKTLPKLISLLLLETDYLSIVSVMENGDKRRNNLLLLSRLAEGFSSDNNPTISSFIRFIQKQSKGIKSSFAGTSNNCVNIMSIHASKGLQFPICIIADTASNFNDSEARSSTIFSTDFGIGFKYFDEILKQKQTTVAREAILDKIRTERLEEELRLFYVAMTRTIDKLVFVGTLTDTEKKTNKINTLLLSSGCELTTDIFTNTKSYLDWLLAAALLHKDGKELRGEGSSLLLKESDSQFKLKLIDHSEIPICAEAEETFSAQPDTEIVRKIQENLDFKYPFEELLNIESKASVSKLANSAEAAKFTFTAEPAFMSGGGITSAGRGTAMHKVMQFFNFSKSGDIQNELERLYEFQFLTLEEYESINVNALNNFFKSELFTRISVSPLVKREMRFLTELPAKRIAPELSSDFDDERIIVQGAVDLCFEEDDGIVILDFKTDRVEKPEQLITAYAEQINIYSKACEKIFLKPIKQKIIYSFSLGKEIIL